ncbi:MAG: J domain-containing protein [Bdellovibrionales bacterium]|nr:J domain-containing protein [Bdellovibrionales bacterium]
MINLFAFLNRKRSYFFALAFVAVASVVLAGSPPEDPLEAVFVKFEKKVNDTFRGLGGEKKDAAKTETLNLLFNPSNIDKDITFDLNSSELKSLEAEYLNAKAAVETASKNRELLPQNDSRLASLSKYVARYLSQQKRLYFNFMRNVHRVAGQEHNYDVTTYDSFNLVIQANAGLAVIRLNGDQAFKDSVGNDVETSLNYNVRHAKGLLNRYTFAEVFMTPQDKDKEELKAIQDTVSEKNYRKIIALLGTRSRLGNHWAIQRMSSEANLADPDLLSCGTNFISFKEPLAKRNLQTGEVIVPETGYYDSMKKKDDYDQFNKKIEAGLYNVTVQTPLLSTDDLKGVLSAYYSTLKAKADDKDGMTVAYKLDLESDAKENDGFIGINYLKNLNSRYEKLWEAEASRSDTGLKLSAYIGDTWHDVNEVAERFAWTAFALRKEMMIAQVIAETDGSKKSDAKKNDKTAALAPVANANPQPVVNAADQTALDSDTDARNLTAGVKGTDEERYAILREWAQQAVESVLTTAKEVEWRAKVKAATLAYLNSKESLAIDQGFKADRLDKTFAESWKTTQNGAIAQYTKNTIKKLLETTEGCVVFLGARYGYRVDTTSPECKYVKDISQYDDNYQSMIHEAGKEGYAAFWPAKAEIKNPLRPLTPDQLSAYLYKKLEFWSNNDEFPDLRDRARKIMSNTAVMKGVKDFFGTLTQTYATLTLSKKLNSAEFFLNDPKENKILAQALEITVPQAFMSFRELLDTKPEREDVEQAMVKNMSSDDWTKISNEISDAVNGRDKNAKVKKLGDKSMSDFVKQIRDKASQSQLSAEDWDLFGMQLKAIALKNMDGAEWNNFSNQIKDAVGTANSDRIKQILEGVKIKQDKTKLTGPFKSFTPTPSPTPEVYYSVDRERAIAIDLYIDAMSMMGMTRSILRQTPVRENVKKYHAKFFIELEKIMDADLTDKELYSEDGDTMDELIASRIAPSVLDQRILADVWVTVAKSQHPILGLQSEIPVFGFEKGIWKGIKNLPTSLTTRPHTQIENIPTLLDKIAATYNPASKVDEVKAKSLMVDTIRSATRYQTNLLMEACNARPLDDDDTFWRRLFDTSRNFRQIVAQINPQYGKYDTKLEKEYRPLSEKAEEWITKAADWFFKASMIVMIAMLTGGIGGALVGIGWNLGVASLFSAVGLDAVASSALVAGRGLMSFATFAVKMTFKTLIGKAAIAIFNVQIALIGYNGFYTLPNQLTYQLQVANSMVGVHTQVATSREHIMQFADMVYGKRVNFYIQAGMQMLFVGRPMLRSVKKTLGTYTKEVIGRQGTIIEEKILQTGEEMGMNGKVTRGGSRYSNMREGDRFVRTEEFTAARKLDNGVTKNVTYEKTVVTEMKNGGKVVTKTTILPKGFKVPTYAELLKTNNPLVATGKWISQTASSYWKFRGLITLNEAVATFEESNKLMAKQVQSFYRSTDDLLMKANERIAAIDAQMTRIDDALQAAKDPNKTVLEEVKLWTYNKFSEIFSTARESSSSSFAGGAVNVGRSAPFADAVMTERATNFIGDLGTVVQETNGNPRAFAESLGKMWKGRPYGEKEAWELLMSVYKKTELEPIKAYWQALIDEHAVLAQQGPVKLESMFSSFNPGDAARHKDMFEWLIRRSSKSQMGAFVNKRFSLSNPDIDIAKFKRVYRDYDGLNQELAAIAKKSKNAAANAVDLPTDYYGTLGLPLNATADEIKKAFRKLSTEFHPDKNPGNLVAEEKFKMINEANEVLSDPAKKALYDENMKNILAGMDLTGEKQMKLLELPGFKGLTEDELTAIYLSQREGQMVPVMFRGKPIFVDGGKEILVYKKALPTEEMLKNPKARYVPVTMNGEVVMADGKPLLVDSKRIPLNGSVDSIEKLLKSVVTNDRDVLVVDLNAQGSPKFKFVKVGEVQDIKHKISNLNLKEVGIQQ